MLPRVVAASALPHYRVRVRFTDGAEGELDLTETFVGAPGLMGELADDALFRRPWVDHELGTLAWPNGVELCPDVLYHRLTGAPLPGQPLQATS